LRQQAERNKSEISLLFEQVRDIINEREAALKR